MWSLPSPSACGFSCVSPGYQSGQIDVSGRISRRGDPLLRTSLDEAATTILTRSRSDSALKRWGLGLKAKVGPKTEPMEASDERVDSRSL